MLFSSLRYGDEDGWHTVRHIFKFFQYLWYIDSQIYRFHRSTTLKSNSTNMIEFIKNTYMKHFMHAQINCIDLCSFSINRKVN